MYIINKIFFVHALKMYGGSRSLPPLILNLFARWGRIVKVLSALTPEKGTETYWIGDQVCPTAGLVVLE
jgi:hypothetical protein